MAERKRLTPIVSRQTRPSAPARRGPTPQPKEVKSKPKPKAGIKKTVQLGHVEAGSKIVVSKGKVVSRGRPSQQKSKTVFQQTGGGGSDKAEAEVEVVKTKKDILPSKVSPYLAPDKFVGKKDTFKPGPKVITSPEKFDTERGRVTKPVGKIIYERERLGFSSKEGTITPASEIGYITKERGGKLTSQFIEAKGGAGTAIAAFPSGFEKEIKAPGDVINIIGQEGKTGEAAKAEVPRWTGSETSTSVVSDKYVSELGRKDIPLVFDPDTGFLSTKGEEEKVAALKQKYKGKEDSYLYKQQVGDYGAISGIKETFREKPLSMATLAVGSFGAGIAFPAAIAVAPTFVGPALTGVGIGLGAGATAVAGYGVYKEPDYYLKGKKTGKYIAEVGTAVAAGYAGYKLYGEGIATNIKSTKIPKEEFVGVRESKIRPMDETPAWAKEDVRQLVPGSEKYTDVTYGKASATVDYELVYPKSKFAKTVRGIGTRFGEEYPTSLVKSADINFKVISPQGSAGPSRIFGRSDFTTTIEYKKGPISDPSRIFFSTKTKPLPKDIFGIAQKSKFIEFLGTGEKVEYFPEKPVQFIREKALTTGEPIKFETRRLGQIRGDKFFPEKIYKTTTTKQFFPLTEQETSYLTETKLARLTSKKGVTELIETGTIKDVLGTTFQQSYKGYFPKEVDLSASLRKGPKAVIPKPKPKTFSIGGTTEYDLSYPKPLKDTAASREYGKMIMESERVENVLKLFPKEDFKSIGGAIKSIFAKEKGASAAKLAAKVTAGDTSSRYFPVTSLNLGTKAPRFADIESVSFSAASTSKQGLGTMIVPSSITTQIPIETQIQRETLKTIPLTSTKLSLKGKTKVFSAVSTKQLTAVTPALSFAQAEIVTTIPKVKIKLDTKQVLRQRQKTKVTPPFMDFFPAPFTPGPGGGFPIPPFLPKAALGMDFKGPSFGVRGYTQYQPSLVALSRGIRGESPAFGGSVRVRPITTEFETRIRTEFFDPSAFLFPKKSKKKRKRRK